MLYPIELWVHPKASEVIVGESVVQVVFHFSQFIFSAPINLKSPLSIAGRLSSVVFELQLFSIDFRKQIGRPILVGRP